MLRLIFASIACFCLVGSLQADDTLSTDKLGKKIDSVKLIGLDGKTTELSSFKDKKGIAVVLLSFDCPVSNSYAVTLAEMHSQYSQKGIQLVAVCPTDEKADVIKNKVSDFKIPCPVFIDADLSVVDALKATTTPESFLLDHNFVMRYRGRIDNSYSARLKKSQHTSEFDLKNAIEDLLAGRDVKTPVTKPIGCPVLNKSAIDRPVKTSLTYNKDILPILQKNCQECHRPGDVGPFSLMNYKQAVNWAEDIKEYTRSHQMPPWKPVGGPEYMSDRRMSEKEIETLAQWVDGGTPEGDPKDAPKPREFVEGWKLGKPDLILEVEDDFYLGPSGRDNFRCFVLPTNLKEDKYVTAYEVRPGNKEIVHHTLNFFDATGGGRAKLKEEIESHADKDKPDHGPGYSVAMGFGFIPDATKAPPGKPAFGGMGGWAPGTIPHFLPEGAGYFLPAGSDMIIQTHYHRNGKPEKDRLSLGLYFAKGKVDKPFKTGTITGLRQFINVIPAGESNYKAKGSIWAGNDFLLHSAMPHMHLLGRSVKITMQEPGKDSVTLVEIPDWDYGWQETYWFKEPIKVTKGTRFDIEAIYDNSSKNPHNPANPPKVVIYGEETTNEMLFGFLGATPTSGPVQFRNFPPNESKK